MIRIAAEAIRVGAAESASQQLSQIATRPDLAFILKPLIPKVQAILRGAPRPRPGRRLGVILRRCGRTPTVAREIAESLRLNANPHHAHDPLPNRGPDDRRHDHCLGPGSFTERIRYLGRRNLPADTAPCSPSRSLASPAEASPTALGGWDSRSSAGVISCSRSGRPSTFPPRP